MQRLAWQAGSTTNNGGEVHISATRFTYRSLGTMPGVFWHGLALRRQWPRVEGAIGIFVAADFFARTTYTVSLWKTEGDLRRWLGAAEHMRLMRQYRTSMESSTAVGWQSSEVSMSRVFREGLDRLVMEDGR